MTTQLSPQTKPSTVSPSTAFLIVWLLFCCVSYKNSFVSVLWQGCRVKFSPSVHKSLRNMLILSSVFGGLARKKGILLSCLSSFLQTHINEILTEGSM